MFRHYFYGVIGVVAALLFSACEGKAEVEINKTRLIAQDSIENIDGALDGNSKAQSDGSRFNKHTFEGTEGESVFIEMVSDELDTFLALKDPSGNVIALDDDSGDGTNAQIALQLPVTGTYEIFSSAVSSVNEGQYTLVRRAASAFEIERYTALQRATALEQKSRQLRQEGSYGQAEDAAEEALSIRQEFLGEQDYLIAVSLNGLALIYQEQKRYEKAEALFRKSLKMSVDLFGNRHPEVASSLNNLGLLYYEQYLYEGAEEFFEESLSIRLEKLDGRSVEVGQSFGNLALLRLDQGFYSDSEELFLQAVNILQDHYSEEHLVITGVLRNMAGLYRKMGRYKKSEETYTQVLESSRQSLGSLHPDVAETLNSMGELYREQGRIEEAEPLYEEALNISKELFGERNLLTAAVLSNSALLNKEKGLYSTAETQHLESLSIRKEILGESHFLYAQNLGNLGALYHAKGQYRKAEDFHKQALEIRREVLGDSHEDVANTLNNLAELYRVQGRYIEVEPLLLDAISIYEEKYGREHIYISIPLNNLGLLYQALGRLDQAEEAYRESLEILKSQLNGLPPNAALTINSLGSISHMRKQYGEAERFYRRAIQLLEEKLGKRHPTTANAVNNLAVLHQEVGRDSEALALYQDALDIRVEGLGENHPDVANSLNAIASLHQAQRRYEEAETGYYGALNIYKEQLGENHPSVANLLNNLSTFFLERGDIEQAIEKLELGLAIEEFHLSSNFAYLSDIQRQAYIDTISATTDYAVSLNVDRASSSIYSSKVALNTLLRRKGRILGAGVRIFETLRQNLASEDQNILDQLVEKRQQLSSLIFSPPPIYSYGEYRELVAQLEMESVDLESKLARRSAAFRSELSSIDIDGVQSVLPGNSALVEYVRFRSVNKDAEDDQYAAYILFPDGQIHSASLGAASDIDQAVRTLKSELSDRYATHSEIDKQARFLDQLILEPLRDKIGNTKQLLISPDGELNRIPFEVLRSAEGSYLVEDYTISYLNSGRELTRIGVIPRSNNPPVTIASPSYGEAMGKSDGEDYRSVDIDTLTVAPLEWTDVEGKNVNALFQQTFSTSTLVRGENATETYLKNRPLAKMIMC